MNRPLASGSLLLISAFLFCSCEAKQKQEAALKQELLKLETEISTLESQLAKAPSDRSGALDQLTKKLESIEGTIATEEAKLADVRQRESDLKAEFDAYKSSHPIR